MNKAILAGAVATLSALGISASASTYTFDFKDNGYTGWQSTFSVSSDEDPGVEVEVGAATYNGTTKTVYYDDSRAATWQGYGLGVCGNWSTHKIRCKDESHKVDGKWGNDLAIFSLDEELELHSLSFDYYDEYTKKTYDFKCTFSFRGKCWWGEWEVTGEETFFDETDLFLDLADGLTYFLNGDVDDTVLFDSMLLSDTFGVGASGKYDAFKITEAVFKHTTPVPLPAAGWMLLAELVDWRL